MAVFVVEQMRTVGRRLVIPAILLEGQLLLAGLEIEDVQIVIALPVERAVQLIRAAVKADGELMLWSERHVAHILIGEPDELAVRDAKHAQKAMRAVPAGGDLLLRLQPRVVV